MESRWLALEFYKVHRVQHGTRHGNSHAKHETDSYQKPMVIRPDSEILADARDMLIKQLAEQRKRWRVEIE